MDGLLGVAGIIITKFTNDYGSFPQIPCVKRTSKNKCGILEYGL